MHYEYLKSRVLRDDTLILTSERGRTYSLATRTRDVRRVKPKELNKPVAGNARLAQFAFVRQWPDVPEPGSRRLVHL